MNCHSSNFALRTMLIIGLLSALVGCTTIATQQTTLPPTPSLNTAHRSIDDGIQVAGFRIEGFELSEVGSN